MHAMHHPHPFFTRGLGGRPGHVDHDDLRHGDPGTDRGGRVRPPRWLAMGGPRRGPGGPGDHGGPGHGRGRFGPPGFGGGFGPPPGFGGPGGRGRGGGRARRGDVRAAVLRLLAERPMHGYQIIQELTERTGGAWNPSPGSVYPTLAALEDQGLIRAEELDGRRTFTLTDTGRAEVERAAAGPAPWDEVAAGTGGFQELRDVVMGVMTAARQVAADGTPSQVTRAVSLLKDTRRKLYQLLAEDGTDEADGR